MPNYPEDDYDPSICPECGMEIDIDINPFNAFGHGRYTALCGCPRPMLDDGEYRYHSSYTPPTWADILHNGQTKK